ncbi:uncharacterized protein LOC110457786 isoform X2 [Mizuhopecten yessoensis]|uniref:uncharacterized protein LOC110457786 isoform X2 n=1 Tax=Mizuhopecten yessoensis TaxID=6573 RepID=UPI000B45C5EE|nr:uncharacterized protein LOC110457786 isoform X2 [Mizuhopecten yessoensis]
MMEEDTERLTLNLNSKRRSKRRTSSILKTTIGPLLDIDPNKQDGCTVPLKKSRQSLSKRVSFAKRHEIKEFPRESPRRWGEDSPAQEPAADTENDTIPVTATVSDQQGVANISEGQHGGSNVPLLPSTSAPLEENNFSVYSQYVGGHSAPAETCMTTTDTAVSSEQPKQWGAESKIDGSSLLKSLAGANTLPREGLELGYHTQTREESGLGSIAGGRDIKVDGMALLQALGGGGSDTPAEPELLSSYKVRESTTEQSAPNNRTMVFPENEYMDQTEALTCHIQLREAEACLKGLKERTPLMALKEQAPCDVRYGALHDEPDDKTIVFSHGDDDMQQTEVLPVGLHLNPLQSDGDFSCLSGSVNRQSLLQSLGGSDETDSPDVLFGKKFETLSATAKKHPFTQDITNNVLQHNLEESRLKGYDIAHQREPTIVFQHGLEMEETGVIHVPIDTQGGLSSAEITEDRKVLFYLGHNSEEIKASDDPLFRSVENKSEEKTLIYQDGADMEQTGVLESNILSNKSTLQQSDNKTLIFQDGADIEQTGDLYSEIAIRSHGQPVNKTLMDGADMEQTEVLDSKISRRSVTQRPVNRTVMDGADMEQTEVLDSKISRRSVTQRPVNQTVMDGADMEQTEVLDSKISRRSIAQRPVNQTVMDGADMEQTEVLDSKISKRSVTQRPVNQTVMDGADMEQTEVLDSKISRRSIAQRPVNQTVMDGADMEQTEVLDSKISKRSVTQRPVNQTVMDGADMEQTEVLDSKISRRSVTQRSVNQTVMDGADMEQTGVIPNNILSNRSRLQQSDSKTQIFQDGADMEQTEVLDSKISRRSVTQRSVNRTVIDGADMEQTEVLDSKISRRSVAQRPVNQTVMDGADMEQTEVLDSKISRRSVTQRPVNQTVMDGADMEQTEVLDSKISRRSVTQRPVNQTVMDGADMEQTEVLDSKISRRSVTQRPVNQTVMDGADMEQTEVLDSKISRRSVTQRPVNQTVMDGADMEQTEVMDSKIGNRSLAQHPVNKTQIDGEDMELTRVLESKIANRSINKVDTCNIQLSEEICENKTVVFQEGVDLDETHVTTSNINVHGQGIDQTSQPVSNVTQDLDITKVNRTNISSLTASARLKRLSARFSLGGDIVTGRLTKSTNGESEVDNDQTQSIPRNTVRLAGPTPKKGDKGPCDVPREGRKIDISPQVTGDCGSSLPQTTAQIIEDAPKTVDMETEESNNLQVIDQVLLPNTTSKQTGELETGITDVLLPLDLGITDTLMPLDLGITDMLPPDDIVTGRLYTSTMADLPVLNKSKDGFVEQKDSSGSDSSQSQSVTSYSVVSNYSNYSMTESMLESTRREVDGPLTVKKLCLLLDIPCLRWLEFQVRNDRCSILPGEQVDASELRNVLRACAVQCPFYLVHSHIYTQAVRQADLKKEKTDELDIIFTQEEGKPELFRAVELGSDQQRKSLREKVLACSKVSSLLGKTQWKNVRTEATIQYRETLKDQYSRLQSQASDVRTALQQSQGLLTALDTAWSDLDTEETELEKTRLPSEEEIQQWKLAQQELSIKVADLQELEVEQTKLTSDRDSIHSELAMLRDRDQQCNGGQGQDVKQMLENLKEEYEEVATDLGWMERCLEWRTYCYEKEAVSYLLYDDSLLLETTLDTSHHRRLLSATLTSSLEDTPSKPVSHFSDKSEDIMGLMHRLIIKSVKEQNILTKFIGTPLEEQYKFLRAVSMIACTGRCLAQEITRIEFNNWVTIQEQGLSVEFWCDEASRKIDIDFDLKLKYRDYSVVPSVRVDIGNFRPEDVVKQLSAVPDVGFRYFERLCQAINLNDMTVIPELDRCS